MDEQRDLSRLDDEERKLLEPLLRRRGGYAGTAGMFLAAFPIITLVGIASKGGDAMAYVDTKLIVKIAGFAVLGILAWRWSVLGTAGLLLWHLTLNTGYLSSPSVWQKVSYFVFALWIVVGLLAAIYRRVLLAKADGEIPDGGKRAERWMKIYQQRALATGVLPPAEILEEMGMDADDPFWKQDNSNPSRGFAVNLDISYGEVQAIAADDANTIKAEDDLGAHVPLIPILETGRAVKFDFVNASCDLDVEVNLTPFEFLKCQAQLLEELLEGGVGIPDSIEVAADRSVFDDKVTRLYWNADNGCWDVTFESDTAEE